jgi:hypothetical protein
MSEIWKDIPGYEGRYQVSDLGRVKSLPNQQRRCEAILKPLKKPNGYISVTLAGDGVKAPRKKSYWVHSLILRVFVGERPGDCECCHGDGDGSNNALSNLRWGTKLENAADKRKHGTMATGTRNGQSKLTPRNVVEIKKLIAEGKTHSSIASMFDVSTGLISQIATNRAWRNI